MGKLNIVKELFLIGLGILSAFTLLSSVDLIPDIFPLVGIVDDVAAAVILSGLSQRYFKFDPLQESSKLVAK